MVSIILAYIYIYIYIYTYTHTHTYIHTFNALPISIAELVTIQKQFIPHLKKFLIDKSLYSTDAYFK